MAAVGLTEELLMGVVAGLMAGYVIVAVVGDVAGSLMLE